MNQRAHLKCPVVFLVVAISLFSNDVKAQVTISGPPCILPGNTYQYIITGVSNKRSRRQICLTGGAFANGSNCISISEANNPIYVTWSDTSMYRIDLNSPSGNVRMRIQSTSELSGGQIRATDEIQAYNELVQSYTFRCGLPNGGSCNPNYTYQWQLSENALNWVDISGATSRDLAFEGPVQLNTFFRRVVMETNSNSVAYSNNAVLMRSFK